VLERAREGVRRPFPLVCISMRSMAFPLSLEDIRVHLGLGGGPEDLGPW
jgi:hypothetical protein